MEKKDQVIQAILSHIDSSQARPEDYLANFINNNEKLFTLMAESIEGVTIENIRTFTPAIIDELNRLIEKKQLQQLGVKDTAWAFGLIFLTFVFLPSWV